LACLYAGTASAFVDAEVMAGKRWYQDKQSGGATHGVGADEVTVAAHIDPIPLVPVSFGLRVDLDSLNKDDLKYSVDSASTASVMRPAIEVVGWLPFVPVVTPYVRLSYPILAEMALKGSVGGEPFAGTYKINGFDAGLGIKWSPLPLIRLLAEYDMGSEQLKADSVKSNNVPQSNVPNDDFNSNAFLVGVEVGI
jgi:hypothetical protein